MQISQLCTSEVEASRHDDLGDQGQVIDCLKRNLLSHQQQTRNLNRECIRVCHTHLLLHACIPQKKSVLFSGVSTSHGSVAMLLNWNMVHHDCLAFVLLSPIFYDYVGERNLKIAGREGLLVWCSGLVVHFPTLMREVPDTVLFSEHCSLVMKCL